MNKYRLKITLRSDLCVSDGGVYNGALDTEVCYDAYGFPFIPAKRLKGCLRECAVELADWGRDIKIEELFGDKGAKRGCVRISDACLHDYEARKKEILENPDCVLYHPQHILQRYAYIRTQTSVDYDLGVADDTTLRTMRVVKKGNVFFADVECEDHLYKDLEECCRVLLHMGIARTRGLGEIKCSLEKVQEKEDPVEAGELAPGANKLWYTIYLDEPVIAKSINGGESRTLDYIEGSKIIGIVASRIKAKKDADLAELLNKGPVQFSNAYITEGEERMLEAPGNFYSIKNEDSYFADKLYADGDDEETKGKQLNSMKHTYVGYDSMGNFVKKDVEVENRYHHRRPEDKSIGRAHDEASGDSTFYQMSSIVAGQTFKGYIYGTPEQIKTIYEILKESRDVLIGYSRTAEYGKASICRIETEKVTEQKRDGIKRFSIKLEAPAIIYGDQAMYSVCPKVLAEEIAAELGIPWKEIDEEHVAYYLKYTDVGGYNVTWGARKPVVTAFDKGTVVDITLKNDRTITIPENLALGERVLEGYGEASFLPWEENGSYLRDWKDNEEEKQAGTVNVKDKELAKEICDELFDSFVKLYAVQMADSFDVKEAIRPTVSNMLLMSSEYKTIGEVKRTVKDRYDRNLDKKKEKGQYAEDILKAVKDNGEKCIQDFQDKYRIVGYAEEEPEKQDIQFRLLKAFLISIKYALRKGGYQSE